MVTWILLSIVKLTWKWEKNNVPLVELIFEESKVEILKLSSYFGKLNQSGIGDMTLQGV